MKKRNHGQTSVEYIFMIASLTAIMVTVMARMKERLIKTGDCRPNDKALSCQIVSILTGPGFMSGDYRQFRLPR